MLNIHTQCNFCKFAFLDVSHTHAVCAMVVCAFLEVLHMQCRYNSHTRRASLSGSTHARNSAHRFADEQSMHHTCIVGVSFRIHMLTCTTADIWLERSTPGEGGLT